jgi:hypothetical protein
MESDKILGFIVWNHPGFSSGAPDIVLLLIYYMEAQEVL